MITAGVRDAPQAAFNRTIVELKLIIPPIYYHRVKPFNRTIVELKLICGGLPRSTGRLLIEPLWN